jgi:allantoicase
LKNIPLLVRAIIKLGCEGTITGFDIDTTNFKDSAPVEVKVEAAGDPDGLNEKDIENWKVLRCINGFQASAQVAIYQSIICSVSVDGPFT